MSQLFEMSLNCVRIVAEMCPKTAIPKVSRRYRRVSQVSLKLYFLYTYVADRLELFQCSLKSATIWPELRYHAILFSNARYPCDTLGIAVLKSIKGLIPMLLGDRTGLFNPCDTFPDFLAQNKIKIKKTSVGIAVFIALFRTQLRHRKVWHIYHTKNLYPPLEF